MSTMSKLHLAENLSLPLDACTQTFAWIGRKGSGKTYGAGKLVEELLTASVQTVILDTVGNWYGLRIAADGKGKGFDVPVFGGLRQDLPLLSTAGEVVADVVMDSRRSVILDVSQFNFSERKRFAADFGTRLWQRKKGEAEPSPLHLVIEECQLIVPQFVQKDDTRMVHVYEEIIRLGRNYGIGASMLTQRPQSVNKEVLTQAECIMAFQINGVPERKALKEWLTYEGGDVNLVNELPSLPVGTCYLWSPQWLRKFQQVTIGKKSTLDASATPKAGKQMIRRDPAPLDVKDIAARMTSTIEKATADNPKQLREKIAELESKIRVGQKLAESKPAPAPTIKEVPVLKDGQLKRVESVMAQAQAIMDKFSPLLNGLREAVVKTANNISRERPTVSHVPHKIEMVSLKRPIVSRYDQSVSEGQLGASKQRILNAMIWAESTGLPYLDKTQLALLSDQSPTSGGYFSNLGSLRTAGLIEYPGPGSVMLTQEGRAVAAPSDVPTTSAELHEMLFRKLSSSQVNILRALIVEYPNAMQKDLLAETTGQSPTSGGYFNNLGRLRSLGLIDYPSPGLVVAQSVLFLEGT